MRWFDGGIGRGIHYLLVAAVVFAPGAGRFDGSARRTAETGALAARILAPTFDEGTVEEIRPKVFSESSNERWTNDWLALATVLLLAGYFLLFGQTGIPPGKRRKPGRPPTTFDVGDRRRGPPAQTA